MRWQLGRRSQNIEDRRGDPMARGFPLPRGIPMSRGARRGGLGGLGLIILFLIMLFFGVDPRLLFQGGTTTDIPYSEAPGTAPPADDEAAQFVATVLGYTEDTWRELFKQMGRTYREPTLVLFSGQVGSACGFAQAAMGPFYCPADAKVYVDLSFYQELRQRFGAPGDFAQAYVIAHEVGHHVQNQLGIAEQVQNARQQVDESQANALSVMMELQADCLAGVWANHTEQAQQILEQGDIEEGLNAAAAIGDDRNKDRRRAMSCPTRSPTAARRSGCTGSEKDWSRATCRPATRSTRTATSCPRRRPYRRHPRASADAEEPDVPTTRCASVDRPCGGGTRRSAGKSRRHRATRSAALAYRPLSRSHCSRLR